MFYHTLKANVLIALTPFLVKMNEAGRADMSSKHPPQALMGAKDQPAMNRHVCKALRATAIALIAVFPLFATTAHAQNLPADCAPFADAYAQQQADAQAELKRQSEIMDKLREQPDWIRNSDGLLTACANNNWPKINLANPLLNNIISGAQEKALKAACDQARKQVSDVASTYDDLIGQAQSKFGSWTGDAIELPSPPSGAPWSGIGTAPPSGSPGIPGISPPVGGDPIP